MTPMGLAWRVAVAAAGLVFGLVSARIAFPAWQVSSWLGDLLTGWALIATGLVGTLRPSTRRVGVIVLLAGFAWFLGDWGAAGGVIGAVAVVATFLHRGFILHAIFTLPSGRTTTWLERGAVVAGYACSLVPVVWTNTVGAGVTATLAVAVTAAIFLRSPGFLRQAKRRALEACAVFATTIVSGSVIRAVWASPEAASVALAVYEGGLVLTGLWVVFAAGVAARPGRATDLVVDVGSERGGSLEEALRWAIGDGELLLGHPTDVPGEFRDLRGRVLGSGGREVTVIEDGGRPVAAIATLAGALDEPGLRASVSTAVRLDAANRVLRADVEAQAAAVRASQRRLIEAGDEEGRRLADRLQGGAGTTLGELAATLGQAGDRADSYETTAAIEGARESLSRAAHEVDDLAHGLHPRALGESGLAGALRAVARDAPVPVDVAVDEHLELAPDVERAVYFLCLEALTNVAKHASATRSFVSVRVAGDALQVEIADDGAGGASLAGGVGLRGVVDRVASFGGVVEVVSPVGQGTRLVARVPIEPARISRSAPTGAP